VKTPYEIIQIKQKGQKLSHKEMEFMVTGFVSGEVPSYQMSALLMAIYFNGMVESETIDYTKILINSGTRLDFSYLPGFVVDKHSTGGVGDKVSLILGPLLAACGCYVPMLSGRGLGHTGGTLDKFASIPGYNVQPTTEKFKQIVEEVGVSIIGQTNDICPADRQIYALRDVTATVESMPLIGGSIMSKKIAEGINGLVLDVKFGNGAFMKNREQGEKLGELLKLIGYNFGLKTEYSLTNMNQPLGNSAGIWCEVQESIDVLKGNGPDDLMEVTMHLCEKALKLSGEPNARQKLENAISTGKAYEKFMEMVNAHGGSIEAIESKATHKPKYKSIITAKKSGYISEIDTFKMGMSIIALGGGRVKQTDIIDNSAGFVLNAKIGDYIHKSDEIAKVFCSKQSKIEYGKLMIENAITISEQKPEKPILVYSS
jgi:pyrimidine-nucleoside phosphorylase